MREYRRSSSSKIISPAAFSKNGNEILECKEKVPITDLTVTSEQRRRVLQRQIKNPNFRPPSTDKDEITTLDDQDIPWYMMTTEQLVQSEKKKCKLEREEGENLSLTSNRDDLSTITSNSSCSTFGTKSTKKQQQQSDRSHLSRVTSRPSSSPSSIHSNKSNSQISRNRSTLPSPRKPKKVMTKTPMTPQDMEKNLSKQFLRVTDLDKQIYETEQEIKRLYMKRKKDEQLIQKVLRDNNRAMEEIDGTQAELSTIYDVALQLLEKTEAGKEAQKARMKQSAAEQEVYRKAILEREFESLRIAHRNFKVNQKTVFHAGDTLSRYERIEYLWNLLREHCWQVGREKVLEKRKIAQEEKELEQQRIEAARVAQLQEGGRRKSFQNEGTSTSYGGVVPVNGVDERRRKSVRNDVVGGVRRNSEVNGNRRKSVQPSA